MHVKRLAFLDAMRGFAVLSMVPFHSILIVLFIMGFGAEVAEREALVEFETPLATGLPLFFFVTGVSLVISLARRLKRQSFPEVARHVVLRYGVYMLIGTAYTPILRSLLGRPVTIESIINLRDPIAALGLAAILAFPLIHRLTWKQLVATASGLALIMGFVLALPQASSLHFFPVYIFFTNPWSVLKTFPLVLTGAAVGKLVLEGREMKRAMTSIGIAITAAYLIVPALTGSGSMLYIFFAIWTYHHAILFIVGVSFFLFGLMRILEARRINLAPLTVLGRTSLLVFYLHLTLGLVIFLPIGAENLSMGLVAGIIVGITAVVWIFCYFYSKWRWGSPSSW
jgi:uncharacterized membrane protein